MMRYIDPDTHIFPISDELPPKIRIMDMLVAFRSR